MAITAWNVITLVFAILTVGWTVIELQWAVQVEETHDIQLKQLKDMEALYNTSDLHAFHYANSREEVNQTVTRYQAAQLIANWFWTHSGSTKHSDNGEALHNALHDMLPDVDEVEGEYEKFLNATLHELFDGETIEDEKFQCCQNKRWRISYKMFSVDYHPERSLASAIRQSQITQQRHWPWKTFIKIDTYEDDRELVALCQGYRCDMKYMVAVAPCMPCDGILSKREYHINHAKIMLHVAALLLPFGIQLGIYLLDSPVGKAVKRKLSFKRRQKAD